MNLYDFNINGFIGSKNNVELFDHTDTALAMRKIVVNSDMLGIDRSLLTDNKTYSNRESTLKFKIKANNVDEMNSRYIGFFNAINKGSYVLANFYYDPAYQYQIFCTGIKPTTTNHNFMFNRVYEVTISAAPFKYLIDAPSVSFGTTSTTITNKTSFNSKPHIKITGSGDITLTVNGTKFSFIGVTGSIELDSSLQTVYRMDAGKAVNENSKMKIGPFPELKPGKNTISVSSGTAVIEPRWRTL
ncbi:hypothetical protein ACJQWY_02175 [Weissella kandleri]|uniref:hypothetical protein n=1 Tax=Weissella kandleri TaxID=1616 RepID=UPI00387E6E39